MNSAPAPRLRLRTRLTVDRETPIAFDNLAGEMSRFPMYSLSRSMSTEIRANSIPPFELLYGNSITPYMPFDNTF